MTTEASPLKSLGNTQQQAADTADKKTQHKLLFEDGQELDLTKVSLIADARPKPQQLQTPKVQAANGNNGRNAFQTRTANQSMTRRKTPSTQRQHSSKAKMEGEDPMQRMANLQRKHGDNASRFRARHASAQHVDSQVMNKIRQDMDNVFGREDSVTSQVIASKRFQQNWQTSKPSQISLHGLQNQRGSRSMTRQQISGSYNMNNNVHSASNISLPQIGMTRAQQLQHQDMPFKRIGPQKPADQILSNLTDQMDEDDAQFFERASQNQQHLGVAPSVKLLQAEYSSRMSNAFDQQSNYHMDLLEEKREEIQKIIWKRQRKAALVTIVRAGENQGKPTMSQFIGRQKLSKNNESNLPSITPQRRRPIKASEVDDSEDFQQDSLLGESNAKKLKKYEMGEEDSDIALSERADGRLNNPNDREEQRIEKLQREVDAEYEKRPKYTTKNANGEEYRPAEMPDLETMKRGRDKRHERKNPYDNTDKHEQRVAKVQLKLVQQRTTIPSKQHGGSHSPSPRRSIQSQKDLLNKSAEGETVKDAVEKVFDKKKVGQEFSLMTEKFIDQKFKESESSPNAGGRSPGGILKTSRPFDKDDLLSANDVSHGFSSPRAALSPSRRKTGKAMLSNVQRSQTMESRASTPETLQTEYRIIGQNIDKPTALRIQKMIKKTKADEAQAKLDFLKQQQQESEAGVMDDVKTITDSSLLYEKQKREDFNSEMDIFSDVDSAQNRAMKRRGTLLAKQSLLMKQIPAADSDEEKESDDKDFNSQNGEEDGEEKEGEQQEDDYDFDEDEENKRESALDERDHYKKDLENRQVVRKEEEELCGPRLTKKIDDFIFQVSVEAGLADSNEETKDGVPNYGNTHNQEMLQSGNTSLFRLEKTKNDDQGVLQKVMDKYVSEFRGQQAFFQLCKMAKDSKWTDTTINNPRVQYYNECTKANSVAKPILSKIIEKQLVLRDLKLNTGDAMGLRDNLMNHRDLVNKLYLDENGLDGNQLSQILEGFSFQKQLLNLTVQGSAINEKAVEQISNMLKRKVPDHLQELHLIHTKAVWRATDDLVRHMRQKNYLRKLSLVEAGLNDFSLINLCEVVRTQKTLVSLDISWNQLMPNQMRPMLEILQKNRRLTNLNLSWNNIMEANNADEQGFARHNEDIIFLLGKIIKHSKTMQHMNLTGTGLSSQVIYEFGTFLRRSRSVCVVHLSGNPGLSQENMEYLSTRVKCRSKEDIERFTRIQAVVKGVLRGQGASSNIITGIKVKVDRETAFTQVHKKDPIATSVADQLLFQRMLGHKEEQPGSGQWYESSKNAVACKPHYKHECWICDGHVYSVLFWSKGMCYKLNPILTKEKTDEIRWEIDRDFGEQEDADLVYENTNVKYSQIENQTPFVCGSFTGWRYRKMISLEEFNRRFEEPVDPFDIACSQGRIRKRVTKRDQCNEYEKRYVEIAELEEKLRYTYAWRHFFVKNLRYKRPFIMNSHLYYERPSPDGTLPEDDDMMVGMGEFLSDTSEDSDSQADIEAPKEEVKIKMSQFSPEEQEKMRQIAAEKLRNPIPDLPDVKKFDKVFILPFFSKPGKHHYMIKYKDTEESRQSLLLKKIHKQEKRYHKQKNDLPLAKPFNKTKYRKAKSELMPECFFYHCDVPKRTEEIPPFFKMMANKVVERSFNKDMSVFSKWKQDTPVSLNQAFNEDAKLWKGYRFIKSEDDKADTEGVLKKYYQPLKDVFTHLASASSWPNIGQLDVCDFATKSKFLDQFVNISAVDRSFIAASLKVAESSAPANGLKRYEFLEILVRLANIKYLESKIVKTYAEATEKLITECILPHFQLEPWQEFRDKHLWCIEVNDIFEANMGNLQRIYSHYKTPTKTLIDIEDVVNMCTNEANVNISDKDIHFAFGYCHMTVTNEERSWKNYQSLQMVEFLEFIGRLAHARFKGASAEMSQQPLVQKVEFIMDDLFQGFGLTRVDVNIEVEEFSESDDDY